MEYLENLDQELFLFLNGLHSPFFDSVMYWISNKYFWIPFYLLLCIPLWKVYKNKMFIYLIGAGLMITLSDQISVHFFKDFFERYRPCHNLNIADVVHLVNNKCGGKFGFVSSHASNTFALATFLFLQFKSRYNKWAYLLFLWAVIVSYSRIYLGVHYPADILGGALLGSFLALVVNNGINKFDIQKFLKAK